MTAGNGGDNRFDRRHSDERKHACFGHVGSTDGHVGALGTGRDTSQNPKSADVDPRPARLSDAIRDLLGLWT